METEGLERHIPGPTGSENRTLPQPKMSEATEYAEKPLQVCTSPALGLNTGTRAEVGAGRDETFSTRTTWRRPVPIGQSAEESCGTSEQKWSHTVLWAGMKDHSGASSELPRSVQDTS
jgi:hypothetical protein